MQGENKHFYTYAYYTDKPFILLVVTLIFRKYTAISTTNYVNQNSCIGSFSPDIENTVTPRLNQVLGSIKWTNTFVMPKILQYIS